MKTVKALFGILAFTAILAVQIQAQSFLTNGLVAYYPFNGDANDASGYQNNPVLNTATLTTNHLNLANSAYSFSGTEKTQYANQSQLQTTTSLTVSCWVLTANTYSGFYGLVCKATPSNPWAGFQVGVNQNHVQVEVDLKSFAGTIPINDGKWHSICVVFDNNNGHLEIFVDGKVDATYNTPNNSLITEYPLNVGTDRQSVNFFSGLIDDVRLFNRGLSGDEVQQLYVYERGGEAHVKEVQALANAQARTDAFAKAVAQLKAYAQEKEAQAQPEIQAKAEAQAKQMKNIETAGFLLVSLVASIFIFKKTKKTSDAARSKKVSELSARLSVLNSEMDRETEAFESWSKKQPEAWRKIKTNLVDSYLTSARGKLISNYDMAEELLKPFWLRCANSEQAFLPPSARPTDEQWLLALKPKIDAENELLKQRQSKIRDILLSRIAPNYETQQYDMADLDEKFKELDLEKTDASSNDPMSDKEIAEAVASLTDQIKMVETSGMAEGETLVLIKNIAADQLEYLRSSIATRSPVLPSSLEKIAEKYEGQRARLQAKNNEELRVLKARHPEKFS